MSQPTKAKRQSKAPKLSKREAELAAARWRAQVRGSIQVAEVMVRRPEGVPAAEWTVRCVLAGVRRTLDLQECREAMVEQLLAVDRPLRAVLPKLEA